MITYTILVTSVLIFIAQAASQTLLGVDLPAALGVKVNEWIVQGQVWRLVTPMFLHGSILHIAFNMYALYNIGPILERHYGHLRFLGLYLLSGFAGNVISFAFTTAPSLGSSTAIFGLLGAEGIFLYHNRGVFGGIAQRALNQIIMVAAVNLFIGMSPNIDNWGHLGGLAGGILFAWFGGPLLHVEGIYPALTLVDGRENRDVMVTGLIVGGTFAVLAGVIIYMRAG